MNLGYIPLLVVCIAVLLGLIFSKRTRYVKYVFVFFTSVLLLDIFLFFSIEDVFQSAFRFPRLNNPYAVGRKYENLGCLLNFVYQIIIVVALNAISWFLFLMNRLHWKRSK